MGMVRPDKHKGQAMQWVAGHMRTWRTFFTKNRLNSFLLSCLVFIGALGITYTLWSTARVAALHELQATFDYRVRDTVIRIEQRMLTYEQVLRGVQGLLSASEFVERDEFHRYVAALNLDENYPGIQGIGIATLVPAAEKAAHIAMMRRSGFREYHIHPEGERPFYVPITHMEPFYGRNTKVLGFDPYPLAHIQPVMDKARDEGIAIISGKLKLLQDDDKQDEHPAFVMYLPLYEKNKPINHLAERRANIIGWVDAPFRMDDLMYGLGGERSGDLLLEIYDGREVSAASLMYQSRQSATQSVHRSLFTATRGMDITGSYWTLKVRSLPAFEAQIDSQKANVIAGTGMLLSLLFAVLTWLLTTSRTRALELAETMTHELRESEERWKFALEGSGDGVWDWDILHSRVFFSKRWSQLLGYAVTESEGSFEKWKNVIHKDDLVDLLTSLDKHLSGSTDTYHHEHRVYCHDGSVKWMLSRGMVISRDVEGKPLRMLGTFTDITKRKEDEVQIRQLAHYDMLTGLPNRILLLDRLDQEIRKSRRSGLPLSLMFIDIDHFKEINDSLGHHIGDLLLKEAAGRLLQTVRETDTVARLGGDEFTIILAELDDVGAVERIAKAVLARLAEPFTLHAEVIYVSASIGITLYPQDGISVEGLLQNADQAMYAAKGEGRNRYHYFTVSMQEAAQNRMRLANDLRVALTHGELFVVYQPIISLATGRIHKAEALVRWRHPVRGLVSPAEFIPIAEETGLIIDIGNFVFNEVAHTVMRWREQYVADLQVSINKSPIHFYQSEELQASWPERLKNLGLTGESITVEITEGLLMDASDLVKHKLLAFRDAGMQVALDDFGTGYSSLAYLKKFDIDYLKIDQSFIRNLTADSEDYALCEAIIVMAHKLNMQVIAEGVETVDQRNLLLQANCDYAQGYLFARPLMADDFERMLEGTVLPLDR